MTKNFLTTTQVIILLNLLCQLIWTAHFTFAKLFLLLRDYIDLLIISVGAMNTLTGLFIGIYLIKKHFKFSFFTLVLNAVAYLFLLYFWYQFISHKIQLERYQIVYFIYLSLMLLFGLSLLLSSSRHRKWLKRAGFLIIINCALNIAFEFVSIDDPNSVALFIYQLFAFLGIAEYFFWLLNLREEIKALPKDSEALIDVPYV